MTTRLQRMSGEELLLMRILRGDVAAGPIDAELERRALHGKRQQRGSARCWRAAPVANRPARRAA